MLVKFPDHGRSCSHILGLVIVAFCLSLLSGCGDSGTTAPARVDQAQQKKAQEYMQNYGEQIRAANKEKAKNKGKAAPVGKAAPAEAPGN